MKGVILNVRSLDAARSQPEVARIMRLDKRQVQRAERSGLAKLRALIEERGLTFEDLMGPTDHRRGLYDRRAEQGEDEVTASEWARRERQGLIDG